jgi:hypothetical protein
MTTGLKIIRVIPDKKSAALQLSVSEKGCRIIERVAG